MKKVIFVADFFIEDTLGGAELHDNVVIQHFKSIGILHSKIKCRDLTKEFIINNKNSIFFIGNFATLSNYYKALLVKNCEYIIYEHDYKFLKNRNPIFFDNFIAPKKLLTNFNFYNCAKKVICLSKFHRTIFENNIEFKNIENIHCSMWSNNDLDYFSTINKQKKNGKYAVIDSPNPIKKTRETVAFCEKAGIDYDLIKGLNYREFMKTLGQYTGLVFYTGHPEPTPRVAIEAKMLNCKFISDKNFIGVAHEDYFNLKGDEMIKEVQNLRNKALKLLVDIVNYEV